VLKTAQLQRISCYAFKSRLRHYWVELRASGWTPTPDMYHPANFPVVIATPAGGGEDGEAGGSLRTSTRPTSPSFPPLPPLISIHPEAIHALISVRVLVARPTAHLLLLLLLLLLFSFVRAFTR